MHDGCVCYLANHTDKAINDLFISLSDLKDCYLKRFPCPVYIFHEAQMPLSILRKLELVSPHIQLIQIEFPHNPKGSQGITGQQLGYRHMCHWFANDIFNHPRLAQHKYYIRLDSDSRFIGPIDYDIFKAADEHGWSYGYITEFMDQPSCADGLWPAVEKYLESHPELKPLRQLYKDIPQYRCYYTNFELCRLDWFRSESWTAYFKHVDDAGGIYSIRWGDHIIRYIGVNLFMPANQIHHFKDIKYFHQGAFNV